MPKGAKRLGAQGTQGEGANGGMIVEEETKGRSYPRTRGQERPSSLLRQRLLHHIWLQVRLEERVHTLPRVAHHEAPIEIVILARIHHERREIRFPRLQ